MTSIEEHKEKIKEHLEAIEEAIEKGAEKRPITIGFNCSSCVIQFFELYLHVANKIPIGKIIKHDWFKKPQPDQKIEPLVERKLNADFPGKQKIYSLIYTLENYRNSLVYVKPMGKQINETIFIFRELKILFEELLKNEGFKL